MEMVSTWVEHKLAALGILDRYTWVILCGMILAEGTYWDAVEAWAEIRGVSWQWMNAHLCYRTLEAGLAEHPKDVFAALADEYRRSEHEN